MSIILWIVVGLIAGLLARALVPGRQPMGLVGTALLGIAGSVIGGLIGQLLWGRGTEGFQPGGLVLSIVGAVLLLLLYMAVVRRRPASV